MYGADAELYDLATSSHRHERTSASDRQAPRLTTQDEPRRVCRTLGAARIAWSRRVAFGVAMFSDCLGHGLR
jgi:hypothetical protein